MKVGIEMITQEQRIKENQADVGRQDVVDKENIRVKSLPLDM